MSGAIERLRTERSDLHSAKAIATASLLAAVVAAGLLVTVVLPAEYGVDPIGTGEMLGLKALSGTAAVEPLPPPQGQALSPVQEGRVALYPGEYKVDSREFVLGPYEYIEYKYHLAKDATMLFTWSASGNLRQDFHGDPDGAPSSAAQSYDSKPRRLAQGSFTAPFSGIHGWYWENLGGEMITVKVTTAGFYTEAHEFHFNGTRQARELRPLSAITFTDN